MKVVSPEAVMNDYSSKLGKIYSYLKMLIRISMRRLIHAQNISRQDKRVIDLDWNRLNHNRIEIVNRIAVKINAKNYLEIGTANNLLFNSVICDLKIGVDPHKGGTVRQTSDKFFQSNSLTFDLIFIDGLHTYSQVLKDVNNSLKFLSENGVIMIHDMFPRSWVECFVPTVTLADWTGDVWKLAYSHFDECGLEFQLITIDHGIGIIRKKQKTIENIVFDNDLAKKEFEFFYRNFESLPIIDWEKALELIDRLKPIN